MKEGIGIQSDRNEEVFSMLHLKIIRQKLDELSDTLQPVEYIVPALWTDPAAPGEERMRSVRPVDFFKQKIDDILGEAVVMPPNTARGGEWTRTAVVYNLFVRLTTAWDHDGNGKIGLDDMSGGFRETGTFLKSIALLPYLKYLGINTIHLLPVTSIGKDGNKGTLGSPYAIRNPYKLDERLAEPFLGLDADTEFAGFVEAAHHLGIRVVTEFVFRTAAKDSDWIPEHPNWFYWIDAATPDRDGAPEHENGYGSPRFDEEELHAIYQRVKRNDTSSLPPPGLFYRQLFLKHPDSAEMIDGKYIGINADGRKTRIPGAFADWPPDDIQPPWNDVTYLKLYDHPQFNYIAYNTIRYYDSRLLHPDFENRGLWNTIINIIPHFQKNFNIDGVMIDMGHALPRRLKKAMLELARKLDPDFAFWEENFAISQKTVQEGYNAAVGYFWADAHIPDKLREFCAQLASHDTPAPFFATSETHNTKRAASRFGGTIFSKMTFAVSAFFPAMFCIHQGFELGETFPVNTGLGFSPEEISQLPSNILPLFSQSALCWNNSAEFSEYIHRLNSIRAQWLNVIINPDHRTFRVTPTSDNRVLCFLRISADDSHAILVAANTDCGHSVALHLENHALRDTLTDAMSGRIVEKHNGTFVLELEPGQVMIIPLTDPPGNTAV